MSYWEPKAVRYDTLYGYAPTRAEWEASQPHLNLCGQYQEATFSQPWHASWNRQHEGSYGISGDDWRFSGTRTCRKIIRPSYDRRSAVYLIVKVYGFKPKSWSAMLGLGENGSPMTYFDFKKTEKKLSRSCNSVADACRKALKLPFLDEEVKALLKRAYSRRSASSIFRLVSGEYVPWLSDFEHWGRPDWWPPGQFFKTHWEKPCLGPDKNVFRLKGTHYKINGGGYSSGTYEEPGIGYKHGDKQWHLIHDAMVEATGSWLPEPVGDGE